MKTLARYLRVLQELVKIHGIYKLARRSISAIRDEGIHGYASIVVGVLNHSVDRTLHQPALRLNGSRPIVTKSQVNPSIYRAIRECDLFDELWYKETYQQHLLDGDDCVAHYIKYGHTIGLDPSPSFSTKAYLDYYRDVRAAEINPLYHYLTFGKREGRLTRPPTRQRKLKFVRFTPEEGGTPGTILSFDSRQDANPDVAKERVSVHLHLFYLDMIDEICEYLRNIQFNFDLLVSIPPEHSVEHWTRRLRDMLPMARSILVRAVPNRGRDASPWLVEFRQEIKESTVFLHVHTKKSLHNLAHAGWFRYLCHATIGSPGIVNQIISMFCENKRLGIVAPCYHWSLASQPNYGMDKDACQRLLDRLDGGVLPQHCPDYPAGSFFWARTATLWPLLKLDLAYTDFEEEEGQIDGTLAHAVERIIGLLPKMTDTEYRMVTADVAYDLTRYVSSSRSCPRLFSRPSVIRDVAKEGDLSRVAVFTCITGGYENALPAPRCGVGVDTFLFSDDPNMAAPSGYKLVCSNYINPEAVRTARFIKTHPHIWFPEYDYACWIDANVYFLGDIHEYVGRVKASQADCGFIIHPARGSVVEEYEELTKRGMIDGATGEAQLSRYESTVLGASLIETNFFVVALKSPKVARFMQLWWAEINSFTHRDQLSVNYAIEASGVRWVTLLPPGRSTRDHKDFIHFGHEFRDRESVINGCIEDVDRTFA